MAKKRNVRKKVSHPRKIINPDAAREVLDFSQLDSLQGLAKDQLKLEIDGIERGIAKYQQIIDTTDTGDTPAGEKIIRNIIAPLASGLASIQAGDVRKHSLDLLPYIAILDPDRIAYITTKVVIDVLSEKEDNGLGFIGLSLSIGNSIYDDRMLTLAKKYHMSDVEQLRKLWSTETRTFSKKIYKSVDIVDPELDWEDGMAHKLGKFLLKSMLNYTGAVEIYMEPMAGRKSRFQKVYLHEDTVKALENYHHNNELLRPEFMPMVIPPIPWQDQTDGGYTVLQKPLINYRHLRGRPIDAAPEMPEVFKAVNRIQAVPWKINERVYGIAQRLYQDEGTIPGMDITTKPIPPLLSDTDKEDPELMKEWKAIAHDIHTHNRQARSRRFSLYSNLQLAGRFINSAEIYFPYHLDWRGRVYPIPGWLHPQGNDLARGLLQFAEGKALEESGTLAIAVHVANLFGQSLLSEDKRLDWIAKNWNKLLQSAQEPTNEPRFWTTAEKPFTALAAIFELIEANEEPDYISYVPVSVDGTCNGLQWISALALDPVGAKNVNLGPANSPADAYTEVGKIVIKKVLEAVENKDENAPIWAEILQTKGNHRKLFKTPAMTYGYGVTQYGVARQIQEAGYFDILPLNVNRFSRIFWLAEIVLASIEEVVPSAKSVMTFLQHMIFPLVDTNKDLVWTSPSGFKVYHSYAKYSRETMRTVVGDISLKKGFEAKIDKTKQIKGIAPNFIHSLDAAHLISVINSCENFAISPTHDSFAYHACNIEAAQDCIRRTFVKMNVEKGNILEDFREQVLEQNRDLCTLFPEVPDRGDFDITKTLNSRYFFN